MSFEFSASWASLPQRVERYISPSREYRLLSTQRVLGDITGVSPAPREYAFARYRQVEGWGSAPDGAVAYRAPQEFLARRSENFSLEPTTQSLIVQRDNTTTGIDLSVMVV